MMIQENHETEALLFRTEVPGMGGAWTGILTRQGLLTRIFLHHHKLHRLQGLMRHAYHDVRFRRTDAIRDPLQYFITSTLQGHEVAPPDIALNIRHLTAFQYKTLQATRRIMRGKVLSYGQLAAKIGSPNACRAIGNALSKNPFPLLIPCHRVIRAHGGLGGFSAPCGAGLKKILLAFEGHACNPPHGHRLYSTRAPDYNG